MSATFKLNDENFRKEFKARLLRSKSELSVTVNRVGFAIGKRAMDATPKADRAEIEKLGLSGYQVFGKSGKRLKKPRAIWVAMRPMRNIYIAKLYAQGGASAREAFIRQSKEEKDKQIIAALKSRIRAISYLKSGWVPIIRTFARELKKSWSAGGVSSRRAKGKATVAQPGINPTATFENFLQPKGPRGDSAHSKMEQAFQRAMDAEADSMAKFAGEIVEKNFVQ